MSPRSRQRLWMLIAMGVCMTGAAVLVHLRVEQAITPQVRSVMTAMLTGSVADVQAWVDAGLRTAEAAAADRALQPALSACAREHDCSALRAALAPYARAGDLACARVVGNDGALLAAVSGARGRCPQAGALDASVTSAWARMPRARATVVHHVPAQGSSSVRVGIALDGPDQAPLAGLVLDLRVAALDVQLSKSRFGNSGETYVFDQHARMLTESRFLAQRQRTGQVLELRRPSAAARPLTRMAQAALAGRSETELACYPNYRGVDVVGTWRWLPELGLGVATELDCADAFRTLNALKRALFTLSIALVLASFAFWFATRSARAFRLRAERAERRAERFGQYRLERKLGEGGMGAVYLASHALLRRKAAIKLLRADRVSPEAIDRFEREAQFTSALTHPNTVAIYDFGRARDGRFYYVMEYLDGLDLHRMVTTFGPLPQARVIHFLRQICGSLAEAHAAGIVHRDIKPANLLVCTRGGVTDTIKVLDFGIVQVSDEERAADSSALGTAEYMAPELFESSQRASPQSDLYSLGVVGYYLLTGSAPFSGGATVDIGLAHLTETPAPPSSVLGQCDAVLEAAILACLKKAPHARPSSAAGLRAMLDRSPLANRWTQAEAEAWWSERTAQLDELRSSTAPQSGPGALIVRTPSMDDTGS